ncbi:MAG: hypothetical protein IPK72_02050 [Candidatus Eisenbacteria bacterium]|nr:hypothetical protein [Candidatus Eisenbacteria bacterium]
MQVLSDGRLSRSAVEWRAVLPRIQASGQDQVKFCRAEKITLANPFAAPSAGLVRSARTVPEM